MKKGWKRYQELRLVLAICAAFGWWGTLYPEFTLFPDTCRVVVCEENQDQDVRELSKQPNELYRAILKADADQVVIKSKLWEEIRKLFDL